MARVTGPLMSFDASGTVAGAIVFAKWRGRNYVRRHAVPSNPRTPGQIAARAIIAFLGKLWTSLGDEPKASWEEGAESLKISPFNQYIGLNARNWRDQMVPSQATPAERTLVGDPPAAIAGVVSGRQVILTVTLADVTNIWGIVVCRSLVTGFTATAGNAIGIIEAWNDPLVWVDGPLAPGTYYYKAFAFSTDGLKTTVCAEEDVTVV